MTLFDPILKDCSKSSAKKKQQNLIKNDSSDTSTVEGEDDENPKNKYLTGTCLLKFKNI